MAIWRDILRQGTAPKIAGEEDEVMFIIDGPGAVRSFQSSYAHEVPRGFIIPRGEVSVDHIVAEVDLFGAARGSMELRTVNIATSAEIRALAFSFLGTIMNLDKEIFFPEGDARPPEPEDPPESGLSLRPNQTSASSP